MRIILAFLLVLTLTPFARPQCSGGTDAVSPSIVFMGDSGTSGVTGNHPYTSYVTTPPVYGGVTYVGYNIGSPGKTLEQMVEDFCDQVYPITSSKTGPHVLSFIGGIGDIHLGKSPQFVFGLLQRITYLAHLSGMKVVVGTLISCQGFDEERDEFNALVRQNVGDFDVMVDLASNPHIGDDGAYSNSTYFIQTDQPGIHLTDAGQQIVGPMMDAGINEAITGHKKTTQNLEVVGSLSVINSNVGMPALITNTASDNWSSLHKSVAPTSHNFGAAIMAGTNANDISFHVSPADNSERYFSIRGDGLPSFKASAIPIFATDAAAAAALPVGSLYSLTIDPNGLRIVR